MESFYGVEQNSFIEVRSGSSWRQEFIWIQKTNNQPVDLTGCRAVFKMVRSRTNTTVLEDDSNDSPTNLTIDELNGKVIFSIDEEYTRTLKPGVYKADLKVIFSDGSDRATDIFQIRVKEGLS